MSAVKTEVACLLGVAATIVSRAKFHSSYALDLERQLVQAAAQGFVYDSAEASADAKAVIATLQELARELPGVTPALWITLAHVAAVHGETEQSLMFAPDLPLPAEFADACLHAAALTTPLWWHINARVSNETGFVFNHFCGCGCHITRAQVQYSLLGDMETVNNAFYAHLAGQYHLLREGYPFNLSE